MKKTFRQWLTTPIGCDSYYDYWDKKINKKIEKKSISDLDSLKRWIKNDCKMKHITEEQKDELIARLDKVDRENLKHNSLVRKIAREALEEIRLKKDLGLISEEEAKIQAKEFADFI